MNVRLVIQLIVYAVAEQVKAIIDTNVHTKRCITKIDITTNTRSNWETLHIDTNRVTQDEHPSSAFAIHTLGMALHTQIHNICSNDSSEHYIPMKNLAVQLLQAELRHYGSYVYEDEEVLLTTCATCDRADMQYTLSYNPCDNCPLDN
jgi:hypothetical protein